MTRRGTGFPSGVGFRESMNHLLCKPAKVMFSLTENGAGSRVLEMADGKC